MSSGILNNKDMATALRKKWRYSSAVFKKSSKSDFYPKMIQNMKDGLPAILGIMRKTSFFKHADRHVIVVDGYRDDGTFHINFGWGAKSPDSINQAWYSLPTNMPSDFNVVKEAVLNIVPEESGGNNPKINSLDINNGASKTYERKVILNNECTGKPTRYMASENKNFKNAKWLKYSIKPGFILSAGSGPKTVFLKVKNKNGISRSKSDSITLEINAQKKVIIYVYGTGLQLMGAIVEVKLDGSKIGQIDTRDPIQFDDLFHGGKAGYQTNKFTKYLAIIRMLIKIGI